MTRELLDNKDRAILAALQNDATQPIFAIAEQAHLSTTACWKRIQRLKEVGIIRSQVCLLDRLKVGLGITVFISVQTSNHDQEWLDDFLRGVSSFPEVMEIYRLAGEIDYLLKVVVPGITEFDQVYKKLISTVKLLDVSSNFCMEEIKYTTSMPLCHYSR